MCLQGNAIKVQALIFGQKMIILLAPGQGANSILVVIGCRAVSGLIEMQMYLSFLGANQCYRSPILNLLKISLTIRCKFPSILAASSA